MNMPVKKLPLLDGLLAPSDLRRLNETELDELAEEIRYRIRETVSRTGGHLASNLGVVELTMALHRVYDFKTDRLLWDVGHQAYVHKLLTGRAENFATNRQKGGISGFPDPNESEYDFAKVGHSSTAISTGVGVAEAFRRLGQKRKTVAVVGDGALTGGMCFEGLINAGELKSDLLVILNDNGNFIDEPVGALHTYLDRIRTGNFYKHVRERLSGILKKLPFGREVERVTEHVEQVAHKLVSPGYIFEDLGIRYFGPIDGHNRTEVEEMLHRLDDVHEPVLLHVLTRKGDGWGPSQEDPLTFHGPKGFDVDTGVFPPKGKVIGKTWSDVFADVMLELAEEDERLVTVTAAMPSGTALRVFAQQYPDRMYDVGICEQHSFAFVEGMAIAGLRPVLAHYSTFAQRGYDQLFQELVLQRNLGVIVALDRAGLVGEDGETHQGVYDISWSRCFPGIVIMAPKDAAELRALLHWAHQDRQQTEDETAAYIVRYPKEVVPDYTWGLTKPQAIEVGKAELVCKGTGRLMVWAYGAMFRLAWEAMEVLTEQEREQITMVNPRFAKPFDDHMLKELATDHDCVLTIEDHALAGGFGSIVLESASAQGLALSVDRLGVQDDLVEHASRLEQLEDHGLSVSHIVERMRLVLGVVEESADSQPIPFRRAD